MTLLVPIMLYGWLPLSIFLFLTLKPHHAVSAIIIGGVLFLPMKGYSFAGFPDYDKQMAIALGLILGGRLSGKRGKSKYKFKLYDVPMLIWCLCPLATSLSNQLGFYDGIAASLTQTVRWGIPYFTGRIYFSDIESLHDLCLAIVVGGLLYIPLCLYEIRMSPQLSIHVYGFFPHSFAQQARYGGFRPIIFMQHGIMVALWMAVSSIMAFWLLRSKEIKTIKGMSLSWITSIFILTTILCKTAGGWFALIVGCGLFSFYKKNKSTIHFQVLLLTIPLYMLVRLTGLVTGEDLTSMANKVVDTTRAGSMEYRLQAEDLYSSKAFERPLLGWGGYGRNRVVNPKTGRIIDKAIDSYWLINFSGYGLIGLFFFTTSILLGPWLILRFMSKKTTNLPRPYIPLALSVIVILFMIDSLMNAMFNSVYILISGALISYYVTLLSDKKKLEDQDVKKLPTNDY